MTFGIFSRFEAFLKVAFDVRSLGWLQGGLMGLGFDVAFGLAKGCGEELKVAAQHLGSRKRIPIQRIT